MDDPKHLPTAQALSARNAGWSKKTEKRNGLNHYFVQNKEVGHNKVAEEDTCGLGLQLKYFAAA